MTKNKKLAFISIIGASNAGKSTLLNKLVGQKVAIVTPKVQTTRTRITGILTEGNVQLVFLDTPGIFRPKKQLDKAMVKAAWNSTEGVDFILLLVDCAKGVDEHVQDIIAALKKRSDGSAKYILVLNKIDKINKQKLLLLAQELNQNFKFEDTFMISAKSGDGVDDLKHYLKNNSREAEWVYPEDDITNMPMRIYAAEITREKLLLQLEHEVPYQLMVETESYKESLESRVRSSGKRKTKNTEHRTQNTGAVTIKQVIYVVSEAHKKIIVGKGGQTIKNVGQSARKELEHFLGKKVNLFLFVKVSENWQDSKESYEVIGLDKP